MTGEDNNGFLKLWKELAPQGFKGIAASEPTWISGEALKLALAALKGEPIQKSTIAPVPTITDETLDQYVRPDLSDAYWTNSKLPPTWRRSSTGKISKLNRWEAGLGSETRLPSRRSRYQRDTLVLADRPHRSRTFGWTSLGQAEQPVNPVHPVKSTQGCDTLLNRAGAAGTSTIDGRVRPAGSRTYGVWQGKGWL